MHNGICIELMYIIYDAETGLFSIIDVVGQCRTSAIGQIAWIRAEKLEGGAEMHNSLILYQHFFQISVKY